jgi:hypothetical protein
LTQLSDEDFIDELKSFPKIKIMLDKKYLNHAEIKLTTDKLTNVFFEKLGQVTRYYTLENMCSGFRLIFDANENMIKLLTEYQDLMYPDPTPKK